MSSMAASLSTTNFARHLAQVDKCVLVVIDIQEKLLPPVFEKERLIKNSQLLIRAAQVLKIPTLLTAQNPKGLGPVVPEIVSLLPHCEIVDKEKFSCFGSEAFSAALKRIPGERTTLLLAGMESHICVAQTALSALDQGYIVHAASDAISARTEWNWKIGLERMKSAGVVISSSEMMIYELLRGSDAAEFKQILPFLK